MNNTNIKFPSAEKWVKSHLRNHIKIELNTTASEVWKVVDSPVNIFSNCCGVNNVELKINDSGKCTEYTISYESENGGEDMIARSTMVWYEPNQGWASLDDDPHPMGFQESLLLITVEQKEEKSVLNWNMYYYIDNDKMLKEFIFGLDQTIRSEIAQGLIEKFGGKILD